MKKYIILLVMFLMAFAYNKCSAQNGISVSVLNDIKLGLGLDKEHLNDSPTLDLIVKVNLEGKQFEYYYFTIQVLYNTGALRTRQFTRWLF